MIEPFSSACLAAIAEITNALTPVTLTASVMAGLIGNRADALFCKVAAGTIDRFLQNASLPENHELLHGVMTAYQRSAVYVADTISRQARHLPERIIADKIIASAKSLPTAHVRIASPLLPALAPLIAGPGEDQAGSRRERILASAREDLIAWFEEETQETFPDHFRRLVAEGEPNGRAAWHDVFRLYLAEEIKANPRFNQIFLASNISEIVGRSITIETVAIELAKGLDALAEQVSLLSIDVKQVLTGQIAQARKLDHQGHQIQVLLEAFRVTPLAAEAREAKLELQAFIQLARKINQEVDTDLQALNELERAVEKLLEFNEAAEHSNNPDASVDRTIHRIAEHSRHGDFESAAAEAANAFDDWEQGSATRREQERHSGLALIEAGIHQHLALRDSVSVATWIERRIVLETDRQPVDAASLLAEADFWYKRDSNLDVAVAIALARRAIALSSAESQAHAQYTLGIALCTLGHRESTTKRLEEAVMACRKALEIYTQERTPIEWALAQAILGNALQSIGEREFGTARLEQSVDAYRNALKEFTRKRMPRAWALIQQDLGNALSGLGVRERGMKRLDEAEAAYRAALTEQVRVDEPLVWASTQHNLANALLYRSKREFDNEVMEKRADFCRKLLEDYARGFNASMWPRVFKGLAIALIVAPKFISNKKRLDEAIAAYREVLKERTQAEAWRACASTRASLASALLRLGELKSDKDLIKEAIETCHEALNMCSREYEPYEWARAQMSLGNALQGLGERDWDDDRLEEAIAAYRMTLEEFTRENFPLGWAMTQENLGNTLLTLGLRKAAIGRLEEAVAAYRAALTEQTARHLPLDWRAIRRKLSKAEQAIERHRTRP